MITRRVVWALGFSQLLMWGVTYYAIAVFGEPIARDTGWGRTAAYGGFSVALVVMGLSSAKIGRLIDEHGGRPVMTAGSVLGALGCLVVASSHHLAVYFAGWAILGLAMRMALYDAAFASLARAGGPDAKRPISQVTLLGGIASTVMWPVGQALEQAFGWRTALVIYAALALATVPLHLLIPRDRYRAPVVSGPAPAGSLAATPRQQLQAGFLYASVVTLSSFLNSAMSAHMIAILAGLGMASAMAVWTAMLRGVGQSAARLAELMFGRRLDPLMLGVLATGVLPIGFVIGLWSGTSMTAGFVFALIYGAGNGLVTIVRGTQPLLLFDPASYGVIVGRLIGPSFFLSALAPAAFAYLIERFGDGSALVVSALVSLVVFSCSFALWFLFSRRPSAAS